MPAGPRWLQLPTGCTAAGDPQAAQGSGPAGLGAAVGSRGTGGGGGADQPAHVCAVRWAAGVAARVHAVRYAAASPAHACSMRCQVGLTARITLAGPVCREPRRERADGRPAVAGQGGAAQSRGSCPAAARRVGDAAGADCSSQRALHFLQQLPTAAYQPAWFAARTTSSHVPSSQACAPNKPLSLLGCIAVVQALRAESDSAAGLLREHVARLQVLPWPGGSGACLALLW